MYRSLRPLAARLSPASRVATFQPVPTPKAFYTTAGGRVRFAVAETNKRTVLLTQTTHYARPALLTSLARAGPVATFGATTALFTAARTTYCNPAVCEAAPPLPSSSQPQPLVRKGELTFGASLGFCTGYLVKKIGRAFALIVGVGFLFLQYLSAKGYVTVHWERMASHYRRQLDHDRDGRVTASDWRTSLAILLDLLTANIQFKSTFVGGFYLGARYG
ncbi:FUN14 family-domain-containing protein [Jimgerdemannia flammicorona]|uniref:FUN14 family-domain-containing protein n=1 Tax=Jimgerdemannia flammicorona TaxID=994334 RepID=A0A433QZ01_9FUNG|nr:FUN14 family-domain-containing protein [Jimgerdemannia flammicorona]